MELFVVLFIESSSLNMNGGWTTKTSPRTMSKQRNVERKVRGLLRTILSRKTLKTGEVKQITMRSPIGMRGMAARLAKLAVEIVNP